MKLFDPHIHMTSRTTADYDAMAAAGAVATHIEKDSNPASSTLLFIAPASLL